MVLDKELRVLRLAQVVIPGCCLRQKGICIDRSGCFASDRTDEHRMIERAGSLLFEDLQRRVVAIEKVKQ